VKASARLGVKNIRLTGGEPTVRPHVAELVKMIAAVPGIEDISMTTNGSGTQSRGGGSGQH
jgi:cyclic pyranopterin phosphate synthase